jgi:predicted dehydrogenase
LLEPSTGGDAPALRRVCIAGGGFGQRYARAFHEEGGSEVVGVCTRTPESAAEIVAVTGGTAYTDFEAMLAIEEPDIVVVATPNNLHHPMTIATLKAGAEVICEKPLGLDAQQAGEMVGLAATLDRRTATSFTWRYLPACTALRALVHEDRLGEIYQVDVRYHTRGFGEVHGPMQWQFDRSVAGSGALANLGSHALDLIHWWFGPVTRVAAIARTVIPARRVAAGGTASVSVEDLSAATLLLSDGTPVSLKVGWVAHVPRVSLEVDVHGSKASAWLRYATRGSPVGTVEICDEDATLPVPIELPGQTDAAWMDLGQACVDRLVASFMATDAPAPPASFADGLQAQCVLDAVIEAATGEHWVEVAYSTGGTE